MAVILRTFVNSVEFVFFPGLLSVGYLGTKPPISAVGGVNHSRTLDYDKVDEEHKQLLQVRKQRILYICHYICQP